MVFVPASEKGDESDYTSLIKIVENITGFEINTIKVTDYNAAVEAMRAGRADIAWYGGKTYIKAGIIAFVTLFTCRNENHIKFFNFCLNARKSKKYYKY
jgi:phosphonate transport system substrate-binding protein